MTDHRGAVYFQFFLVMSTMGALERNYDSRLLSRFTKEFCAPVVMTVTTAEVENTCLKNGLLFHELMSGFGHLDNVNSTTRTGSSNIVLQDAQIRFESATDARAKTGILMEERLGEAFVEADS